MRNYLSKYMSWPNLKDKFIAIYVNEFTEEEIRILLVFYKTEVGKKAIEKIPVLLAKGAQLGQEAVQEHMTELTEAVENRAKELNKNK